MAGLSEYAADRVRAEARVNGRIAICMPATQLQIEGPAQVQTDLEWVPYGVVVHHEGKFFRLDGSFKAFRSPPKLMKEEGAHDLRVPVSDKAKPVHQLYIRWGEFAMWCTIRRSRPFVSRAHKVLPWSFSFPSR